MHADRGKATYSHGAILMYSPKYCKSCGCYIPDNYTSCPSCGKTEEDVWFEQSTKVINENWASIRKASLNKPVIGQPRILKQ